MPRKRLIRLIALTVALLFTASVALADIGLLSSIDPARKPLSVSVKVKVSAFSPLDEVRTGWLDQLLSYHELLFSLTGDHTDMSLMVNGTEALSISLGEEKSMSVVSTSLLPGQTYAVPRGDATALDVLLGNDQATGSASLFPGLSSLQLLDDCLTMLKELVRVNGKSFVVKKKKNVLKGFGTATRSMTLTMKEDQATDFGTMLISCCPDGKLMDRLIDLNFTDEQVLTLLTDDKGTIYKISYSGICGTDGNMRRVSLNWRLLRTDTQTKDEISLKLPFAASAGRDQLSFARSTVSKGDTATDALSFKRSSVINGIKAGMEFSWDLTEKAGKSGGLTLGGSASLITSGTGETSRDMAITVNLSMSGPDQGEATIQLKDPAKGTALQQAVITATISPLNTVVREEAVTPTDLQDMTSEAVTALRTQMLNEAARELVGRWIGLPDDAALYITKDLPDDFLLRLAWAALDYSDEEE